MRRRAYPYGRYLIKDRRAEDLGTELKSFLKNKGFHISKYDTDNEGRGTLIIALNKSIMEMWKREKPPGKLSFLA